MKSTRSCQGRHQYLQEEETESTSSGKPADTQFYLGRGHGDQIPPEKFLKVVVRNKRTMPRRKTG